MSPSAPDVLFYLPDDQEDGTYANAFSLWHSAYDFTIDFGAVQRQQHADPEDADSRVVTPARIVARVRIPAQLAFELIRMINAEMAIYESKWGEIHRPPTAGEEEP